MNRLATLFVSLSVVLVVACKKDEEKPAEGAKPTAGAAGEKAADKGGKGAAPAAAAASCPEGALKNDEFGFCLKVPPNFKELRRNQQMGTENLTYGDPAAPQGDTFGITVYPKEKEGHFKNELMTPDMIAKNPANKNVEQADLPGGVKYIAHDSEWGDRETFAAGTGTKASGVVCRTRHSTTFPNPELDAVCKTLVVF